MSTDQSLVSVVLPVHNGMPYLPATIDSLREQTMPKFEVVVVDDGSVDNSPNYLRSIDDPRFRYLRVERAGIANALNLGIQHARTDIIARIDADDIAMPHRLERQIARMRSDSVLVLLGCQFSYIDATGTETGRGKCPESDLANRWLLLFRAAFVHPGVMFRRSAAQGVGGYDPTFDVAQDYDLWIRLATKGRIENLPDTLIQKRALNSAWGARQTDRQRGMASLAAGKHGVSLGLTDDPELYRELYAFASWGALPATFNLADLVSAFRRAVVHFRGLAGPNDDELREATCEYERQLRWRCLEYAQSAWMQPWDASGWLHRARQFDPDKGGLVSLIRRRARRLVVDMVTRNGSHAKEH